MARQKRIWRESQHPRDARGRFAKRGGAAWAKRAAAELMTSAATSAGGRPRISRNAKAGAVLESHLQGGRPSAVRVPQATKTAAPRVAGLEAFNAKGLPTPVKRAAPTVDVARFNAPGDPTPPPAPVKRAPRQAPGAAALIAARATEQAPQVPAMVAARTEPAKAPSAGAAGYAAMRRHTLVSLARNAGVRHQGRTNTEIGEDLAAKDAEVKASRAAKLNPSGVGTATAPTGEVAKLEAKIEALTDRRDAARERRKNSGARVQSAAESKAEAALEEARTKLRAARTVDTPRVGSDNGGMTSTTPPRKQITNVAKLGAIADANANDRRAKSLATRDGVPPTDGRPDITTVATGTSKNDYHRWSFGNSTDRDRTMAPDMARVSGGVIDGRPARAELYNPKDGTGDYRYRIIEEGTGKVIEEGTERDAAKAYAKADRIFSSQRGQGMARTAGKSERFEARKVGTEYHTVAVDQDGKERTVSRSISMDRAQRNADEANRLETERQAREGVPAKKAAPPRRLQTFSERMAGDMSQADILAAHLRNEEERQKLRARETERARQIAEAEANDTRPEREKLAEQLQQDRAADSVDMRGGRRNPQRVARIKKLEARIEELDTEDRKAKIKSIRKGDKVTTTYKDETIEVEVVGKTSDGYLRVLMPDGRRGSLHPKFIEGVTPAPKAEAKAPEPAAEMSEADLDALIRSKGLYPDEFTAQQKRDWLKSYEAAFGPVKVQAENDASKVVKDLKVKLRAMELDRETRDLNGDPSGLDEDEEGRAKKAERAALADLKARLLDAERAERGYDSTPSRAFAKLSDDALERAIKAARPGTKKLEDLKAERDARAAARFKAARPKADAAPVAAPARARITPDAKRGAIDKANQDATAAKRAANLEKARAAATEAKVAELRRSDDPKDNSAKINAIRDGRMGSADLYRQAHAGPSGQRKNINVGRVRYTPDNRTGEYTVTGTDGETSGYVTATVRDGESKYSVYRADGNGGTELLGWADTLAHAADVLTNGEAAASTGGTLDARRISGRLFERNPNRNKTLAELDREAFDREIKQTRESLANPDLLPTLRSRAEKRLARLEAERRGETESPVDTPRVKSQNGGEGTSPTTEATAMEINSKYAGKLQSNKTDAKLLINDLRRAPRLDIGAGSVSRPNIDVLEQMAVQLEVPIDPSHRTGGGRISPKYREQYENLVTKAARRDEKMPVDTPRVKSQNGGMTTTKDTPAKPKSKLAPTVDAAVRLAVEAEDTLGPQPQHVRIPQGIVYDTPEWHAAAVVNAPLVEHRNRRRAIADKYEKPWLGIQGAIDRGLIERDPQTGEYRATEAGRQHVATTSPAGPIKRAKAPEAGTVVKPSGDRPRTGTYAGDIQANRAERLANKELTDHVKTLTLTLNHMDDVRANGFDSSDEPVQVGDEVMVHTFDRFRRGIVTQTTRGGANNGTTRVAYATPTGGYAQETTSPTGQVYRLVDPSKRPGVNRAALLPPVVPEAKPSRKRTPEQVQAQKDAEKAAAAERRQRFFNEKIEGITEELANPSPVRGPEWHLQMTTEEALVALAKHLGVKVPRREKTSMGYPKPHDRDALRKLIIDAVRARSAEGKA